jgi:muramoyltetrapeptide carboxypeptidase
MSQSVTPDESDYLERAILHALRDFEGPIAIGLRSGHVGASNITIPLGVAAALDLSDAGNPRMHLLEAAVTV